MSILTSQSTRTSVYRFGLANLSLEGCIFQDIYDFSPVHGREEFGFDFFCVGLFLLHLLPSDASRNMVVNMQVRYLFYYGKKERDPSENLKIYFKQQ